LNHIALGGFYIGFSSTEVSVVSVVSPFQKSIFDQPQVQQHMGEATLADEFFPKLLRLKLMATAPEC